MPATQVGIVYSKNQRVIRRIIHTRWIGYDENHDPIPDPNADDSQLDHHKNAMLPGEAWATVPFDIYDTHQSAMDTHAYLGLTGIPGITDRCIVHANGKVVAVTCGDPMIDTHPLGTLVADATGVAAVGLAVINGIAQIPVVVSPVDATASAS